MRRKIANETWEQIHTAYAGGIGLREIARNMGISDGTVLAYAKRKGWSQQIQTARENALAKQSDAIRPIQSVPESLAAILAERKERTKLGLSKYAAEAAERAFSLPIRFASSAVWALSRRLPLQIPGPV